MKTKLRNRPYGVEWTESGRVKFRRIRTIVQGSATEEAVQRALRKQREFRDFISKKKAATTADMQRRQDELVEQQSSLWSNAIRRVSGLFRWRVRA